MAGQIWLDPDWTTLAKCTPLGWEFYIRGALRNRWTTLSPEARELIYINAVALTHQQLKEE
jgi:hypothetical protein